MVQQMWPTYGETYLGQFRAKYATLASINVDVSLKRPTFNMLGSTHCGAQMWQNKLRQNR